MDKNKPRTKSWDEQGEMKRPWQVMFCWRSIRRSAFVPISRTVSKTGFPLCLWEKRGKESAPTPVHDTRQPFRRCDRDGAQNWIKWKLLSFGLVLLHSNFVTIKRYFSTIHSVTAKSRHRKQLLQIGSVFFTLKIENRLLEYLGRYVSCCLVRADKVRVKKC